MRQYYIAVILSSNPENGHVVRAWLNPHERMDSHVMAQAVALLSPEGHFYKSCVVWAGNYANIENNVNRTLYELALEQEDKEWVHEVNCNREYRYLVNHTKNEYVELNVRNAEYHPLAILTREGNGRGSGDYDGLNMNYVGRWARDVISAENVVNDGYRKLECRFVDNN